MSRWARVVATGLLSVAGLVGLAVGAAAKVSDRLWFGSLGYSAVYDRQLIAKTVLFFGFGSTVALIVVSQVALAFMTRPKLTVGEDLAGLAQFRAYLAPIRHRVLIALGLVLGLIAGRLAASHWSTLLMWRFGRDFGTEDPYFHRDAGFYVFDLPWWHVVSDFVMTGLILALLAATIVHYLYGGLRLQAAGHHLTRVAGVQLAALGAVILTVKGAQSWLGRFDAVTATGTAFSGMSRANLEVGIPGQELLAWAALICAGLLSVAAWRGRWLVSMVGLSIFALLGVGVGALWPAALRASENVSRDTSFVANNIAATRTAFGLTGIAVKRIPVTLLPTPTEVLSAGRKVRADYGLTNPTLGVLGRLEVGYYSIAGHHSELIVGVRQEKGHDVLSVAFANPGDAGKNGLGWWTPEQLQQRLGVTPQAARLAIDPVQFDTQVVERSSRVAGYSLDSWSTRFFASINHRDASLLNVGSGARLTDLRQPLQRAQKLAPWLTLDSQPYPTVVNGRVLWVIDGYTTSATYPESQLMSLNAMTTNAATPHPTFGVQKSDVINYIRNSVKVVVDASSGAVDFYTWDTNDPIVVAMDAAFPGLLKPRTSMPSALISALRYPTTMFVAQRAMMVNYRETNPATFLAERGRWLVQNDLRRPLVAEPQRGWVGQVPSVSSVYLNKEKDRTVAIFLATSNVTAGASANLELREFTGDKVISPDLAVRRFASDPRVVAFHNKTPRTTDGSLLAVPMGRSLLYVRGIFEEGLQPGSAKAFMATFGARVGFGPTLADAIRDLSSR